MWKFIKPGNTAGVTIYFICWTKELLRAYGCMGVLLIITGAVGQQKKTGTVLRKAKCVLTPSYMADMNFPFQSSILDLFYTVMHSFHMWHHFTYTIHGNVAPLTWYCCKNEDLSEELTFAVSSKEFKHNYSSI